MSNQKIIIAIALAVIASGCVYVNELRPGETIDQEKTSYETQMIGQGIEDPWAVTTHTENTLLVTENHGAIKKINLTNNETTEITTSLEVNDIGQGGLLDIETHPNYPEDNWIYVTYSGENQQGHTATHLARMQLTDEQTENLEILKIATPFKDSTQHYGSRITFNNSYLYITTGDRGDKDFDENHVSQNTSNLLGATLRLNPDGTTPETNPYTENNSIKDEIYSYGHRNSQGMTVHPETQEIWQSEHGEQDGDEINIIKPGNYGWPITHTGCTYATGTQVGEHPEENPETINPVHYWECSSGGFPPAGATFYTGNAQWDNNLFIGNLAGQYLGRFEVENNNVTQKENLLEDKNWRIRDVEQHSDSLYVVRDGSNTSLIKLTPE